MSTTAQTTAADLALALRATLAPLRGSSGASRRKGLIWFELTAAGSYRLTSTWQRQWARAHAPNPAPTPYAGPALPPCALNVRDAEELVAVLSHWRSVPADTPVRILTPRNERRLARAMHAFGPMSAASMCTSRS